MCHVCCCKFCIAFYMASGPIWGPIWEVLGVKLGTMLVKLAIILPLVCKLAEVAKTLKSHWFLQCFWPLGLSTSIQNRSKVDQKLIKKLIKLWMSILVDFLSNLDQFWIRGLLGRKKGACSHPVSSSKITKSLFKIS